MLAAPRLQGFIGKVLLVDVRCNLFELVFIAFLGARLVVEPQVNVESDQVNCPLIIQLLLTRLKIRVKIINCHWDVEAHVDRLNALPSRGNGDEVGCVFVVASVRFNKWLHGRYSDNRNIS